MLPGIGSFTVIDGNDVTDADRANNFFLTSPQPTKPRNRALVTVEAMHELNDEVLGSYIPHHVDSFINSESSACAFFKRFSIVVVSQMGMGHHVLNHITAACYNLNVPLLIVRSYGLLGYLRIQAREIGVLDSKEDDVAPDLRLYEPFPALREFVNSFRLDQITDTTEISHVPFLVILSKAVSEFKSRHAGRLPNSRQEKDEFLDILQSLRPKICPDGAENFGEAEKRSNMRLCYADAAAMTSVMRQLLTDPRSDPDTEIGFVAKEETHERIASPEIIRLGKRASRAGMNVDTDEPVPGTVNSEGPLEGARLISQENASFWVHVAGVRSFFEKRGCLPLRGSLPDMTADTESYVTLQKIYSAKAAKDAKEVFGFVQKIVERYGVDVDVDEDSVRNFCRTVNGIRVFSTRSVEDERLKQTNSGFLDAASMEGALDASGNGFASPYYACLRAVDEFYRQHGRNAGCDASMRESDAGLVHEYMTKVKEELGVSGGSGLWRDYAEETVRYANVELHNIAAFMAGVAAQEVAKIVTRQFVPFDNTLLVNFAEQTSVTFAA